MNQRLRLFASQIRHIIRPAPSRKLYTDPIYPYPHKYFNEYKFPSMQSYRENVVLPKGMDGDIRKNFWMMRFFWTFFFWCFFHDPYAAVGHHTFPDPSQWTDAELGIPPLEAGSYKEWLAKSVDGE